MWLADQLPVAVDAVWWFPGGQLGMAFLGSRYAVKDKLTLISTWDGDEVSLLRTTLELRAARPLPIGAMSATLERIIGRLGPVHGRGFYRAVTAPHATHLARTLEGHGVRVRRTSDGALLFAPSLDFDAADAARLEAAIAAALGDEE